MMLRRLGYTADAVANGVEVLQALEAKTYDVVFLDVQMPEMDGYEAARRIRARWAANEADRPSMVAMTGNAMQGDRERCLEAGMDGHVSKPIRAHEMYAAIDELMSHRIEAAPLEPIPPGEAVIRVDPGKPLPSPAAGNGQRPLDINWEEALVCTGGDRDLMQTMIEVFLQESPRMLDEARSAAAAKDSPRLRRAGHSLKGSCGYFAVPEAYEAALHVEWLAEGGDLARASKALDQLSAEIDRLRPALARFREMAH
jgi:CheY-like chemotaxis protein